MIITFSKAKCAEWQLIGNDLAKLIQGRVDLIGADLYQGNLRADITWAKGRRVRFVIRARSSRAYGARRSWTGRRSIAASWEAHRDCMRALFAIDPNARLRTGMAFYNGADGFERTYLSTSTRNIGSQMRPAYMRELSLDRDGD